MIFRVIAAVLTVLISVSPLAANNVFLADCQDQSCCCNGAVMAGHAENAAMIQALRGSCCHETAGSACVLTTVTHPEKFGWALPSDRKDSPASTFSEAVIAGETLTARRVNVPADIKENVIHRGSPPLYLSSMSFLC